MCGSCMSFGQCRILKLVSKCLFTFLFALWAICGYFEKENKSTKVILVISVNIFWLLRPLHYRPNIKLIRIFQRVLSFCLDCSCGAAMWSGCDVLPKMQCKAKQKKIWFAISKVKSQVCWGIFVCIIENRCFLFVGMQFAKTHEVDISDVLGLLHWSSFHLVQPSEVVWFPLLFAKVFNISGQRK